MTRVDSAIPSFIDRLSSDGPAPDRAEGMKLYGFLVGRWSLDVEIYQDDGSIGRTQGFACAEWVLQGRAIQDVFAVPGLFYGSTLRVFDPERGLWHVFWADPLHQVFVELTGRQDDAEIVNEGPEPANLARLYRSSDDGPPSTIRWIFSDITDVSFTWRSERAQGRSSGQLQRKYFAHRVSTAPD